VHRRVSVNFRRYRRERQASRARDDLPAAGTSPSFPFRPYSGDSARRCWPSARAGPEVVSKAIISDSSAADCNPPSRATLSEYRPPNQVHKVIRFACRCTIARYYPPSRCAETAQSPTDCPTSDNLSSLSSLAF
jgi:hypothetical protein